MKSSSRALKMAHIMRQDKPRFPWSELVKRAWYFIRFREWLKSGIVTFSFYKQDGSIREAKGTLHPLLIPEEDWPTSDDVLRTATGSPIELNSSPLKGRAINYAIINYYDVDKKAWRSFNICGFIGFVTLYKLSPFNPDRQSSTSLSAPRSSRSAKRSMSSIQKRKEAKEKTMRV